MRLVCCFVMLSMFSACGRNSESVLAKIGDDDFIYQLPKNSILKVKKLVNFKPRVTSAQVVSWRTNSDGMDISLEIKKSDDDLNLQPILPLKIRNLVQGSAKVAPSFLLTSPKGREIKIRIYQQVAGKLIAPKIKTLKKHMKVHIAKPVDIE